MIQNIIATAEIFGGPLDLHSLSQFGKYNPSRFPGLFIKFSEPKGTCLVFSSGKVICLGTKCVKNCVSVLEKCFQLIKTNGFPSICMENFKFRNFVGSYNIKHKLDLYKLYYLDRKACFYEIEIFPGLIYRMENPNVTLLIFSTGKFIVTGATSSRQVDVAYDKIYPLLQKCFCL